MVEYRKKNRAKIKAYMANYSKVNRATIRQKHKVWRDMNNGVVRNYSKKRRVALRASILNLLGCKCSRCGFDDVRALDIDHVNNDGFQDRSAMDWTTIMAGYASNPKRAKKCLQILCRNCNWIKHLETLGVDKHATGQMLNNRTYDALPTDRVNRMSNVPDEPPATGDSRTPKDL